MSEQSAWAGGTRVRIKGHRNLGIYEVTEIACYTGGQHTRALVYIRPLGATPGPIQMRWEEELEDAR